MALIKEITTNYGVTAEYWIIDNLHINRATGAVYVEMVPYVSEAARRAGAEAIVTNKVNVRIEDVVYPEGSENESIFDYTTFFSAAALEEQSIYVALYNYVKTHIPEFAGAEDA